MRRQPAPCLPSLVPRQYALRGCLVVAKREVLGQNFLGEVTEIVRDAFPGNASTTKVNATLRRMMESLHGTAALWLAHPSSYDLTLQRAMDDVEAIWSYLLRV